jgi:hypothetical protein
MSQGMAGGRGRDRERGKRKKLQQAVAFSSFDIQYTSIENLQDGRSVT